MAVDLVPMLVEIVVWSARNDPGHAAPADFIARFEEDREGLIAAIRDAVDSAELEVD